MRRHPLAGRPPPLLVGVLVALLHMGCVAAGPAATATASVAAGVTITTAPGETLAFEPAETTVPAPGPVTMTFRNGSSLAHNLVFTTGLTAATQTIVEPGTSELLLLVPPTAGTYAFVCTIHNGMAGRLIVGSTVSGERTHRLSLISYDDPTPAQMERHGGLVGLPIGG